ncbi:MAG: MBL fold metallo-hydrolase [Sulfolobales archaeon]
MSYLVEILKYVVGPLETNCYVVIDRSLAVVIDPGWYEEINFIINDLRSRSVAIDSIIATHGHFDHVSGVRELKKLTDARFLINKKDLSIMKRAPYMAKYFLGIETPEPPQPDLFIAEGDLVKLNNVILRIIETPGHTKGSVSIILEPLDKKYSGRVVVFTGDTLFKESIGRIDFPESDPSEMIRSLRRLAELPKETMVYPGHGPETSIEYELRHNYFFIKALREGVF